MTRLPIDLSQKLNPAWILASSQMSSEEDSWEDSSQHISGVLRKKCSNFTLNLRTKFPSFLLECPPQQGGQDRKKNLRGFGGDTVYRRRSGVKTMITAWRESVERVTQIQSLNTTTSANFLHFRELWEKEVDVSKNFMWVGIWFAFLETRKGELAWTSGISRNSGEITSCLQFKKK